MGFKGIVKGIFFILVNESKNILNYFSFFNVFLLWNISSEKNSHDDYSFKPKLSFNKNRDFGWKAYVLKLWNPLVFLPMFHSKIFKKQKKVITNLQ